jgi:formate dehydrogenase subunit beta
MADGFYIKVDDQSPLKTIQGVLKTMLDRDDVRAILAPSRLPMKDTVMPVLVADPDDLDRADPLTPAFPLNAARLLGRLTRGKPGNKVVAVLRPCEIRAFIELVKLKQGDPDDVVIIGLDCPGTFTNRDLSRLTADQGLDDLTSQFLQTALNGGEPDFSGIGLSSACRVCEHMTPEGADIVIGLYGVDLENQLWIEGRTEPGREMLEGLPQSSAGDSIGRDGVVADLRAKRIAARDQMFERTREEAGDLGSLSAYLASCVNCYNCRVACPVCYCRECVFTTSVFDHEPIQYLQWADRKGSVKMPTDTVFYHLTRLAHMSSACVGCGQCSNACPNDVPVMELFRSVAHRTQAAFDYQAGRSLEEAPPLSVFKEDEYQEVLTG